MVDMLVTFNEFNSSNNIPLLEMKFFTADISFNTDALWTVSLMIFGEKKDCRITKC